LLGCAIPQLIRQISDDILQVEEGSLDPVLQRLELKLRANGDCPPATGGLGSLNSRPTADGRRALLAIALPASGVGFAKRWSSTWQKKIQELKRLVIRGAQRGSTLVGNVTLDLPCAPFANNRASRLRLGFRLRSS
jgi:hypothetical protein